MMISSFKAAFSLLFSFLFCCASISSTFSNNRSLITDSGKSLSWHRIFNSRWPFDAKNRSSPPFTGETQPSLCGSCAPQGVKPLFTKKRSFPVFMMFSSITSGLVGRKNCTFENTLNRDFFITTPNRTDLNYIIRSKTGL